MKPKAFTVAKPKIKTRGLQPPQTITHKSKAKDYNRKVFKNSQKWEQDQPC